jgi:hypothetical protein
MQSLKIMERPMLQKRTSVIIWNVVTILNKTEIASEYCFSHLTAEHATFPSNFLNMLNTGHDVSFSPELAFSKLYEET